jgi:hypothetical protein
MILNVPFIADLQSIQDRRQKIVNQNLRRQNIRRFDYDYRADELVLIRLPNPMKLQEHFTGPYTIRQVHTNGTVTIQIRENIIQRINIRRIKPLHSTLHRH